MKKINFTQQVLPHIVAVGIFLIVTLFFFNPVFFDNKTISQHDIQQWEGSAKTLRDYRDQTGEEGLWADNMFSGMPAYLINVQWSNGPVSYLKRTLSLFLPHPVNNIFLAFVCYYILLLAFRVRPYLAIGAALAFGLSSYMIIGLVAGHNSRIGAIAFMPLVMAGIHLAYTGKRILGFGITTGALALQLKENHLQITYYLLIIALVYGLVQLIFFTREKKIAEFAKTTALLIPAALIGVGTFLGQLWGVTEYGAYTIRGKSELAAANAPSNDGLSKSYAFDASNGIWEPMMLLIPDFYGGSAMNYIVQDRESEVYKVLSNTRDQQAAEQLARFTSAYWGPQSYTVPYYAGAIIVFLFAVGIAFAEKKYVWWLVAVSVIGIMISWGSSFETFNYFLFDNIPGFNKFRSVTFALIITIFALPLLGMLGLERLLESGLDKSAKRKLLIAFGATGGLCLLIILFAGVASYLKEGESQLPPWFSSALADDRKGLRISDAFRSLVFMAIAFLLIYLNVWKKAAVGFYAALIFLIIVDVTVVDKRYITRDNFERKRDNTFYAATAADQEIQKDKSYYRVYNLQSPWNEAHTSYFHYSVGGYHGAKLRRYQDLYDSCLSRQTEEFIRNAQAGQFDFVKYGGMNMLNVKYIVYGPDRNNIIPNPAANGNGWFVKEALVVNSATEELKKVCDVNTRDVAVVDGSQFKVENPVFDSTSTIQIVEHKPNYLKYESQSQQNGLAVFSEIYYPKGWKAFIDGTETPILRADYVLRALQVPSGKHTLEFKFEPAAYVTGNKVTMASSWLMLLVLLGSLGWNLKKDE